MRSLLLSFDVEDWHQLLAGRLGLPDPEPPGPAFPRQMAAIFDLLAELDASATFFMLGKTVERYPDLAREVVERGHEPACHGFSHDRVHTQTRAEFRADVERSVEMVERITGRRPVGYRAPAFSIDRTAAWAYEVLAELGFRYDSSQHDSPRIARRIGPIPATPYRLKLESGAELMELPVAVWHAGGRTLPLGGGSYWRALPSAALRRGLREVARESDYPMLYFHPYEFDPRPLWPSLPPSVTAKQRLRAFYRPLRTNPGRARVPGRLRAIASEFELVSYARAAEAVASRYGGVARTISPAGELV